MTHSTSPSLSSGAPLPGATSTHGNPSLSTEQLEQVRDNEAIRFFLAWWHGWHASERHKIVWVSNAKHIHRLARLGYLKAVPAEGVGCHGVITPQGQAFINLAGGLKK